MNDAWKTYRATGSAEAFAELVRGHVDAVYSHCLRQLRDPGAAEDATQATFVALARRGRGLSAHVAPAGWLYTAARYACANVRRAEARRRNHERRAAAMREETVTGLTDGGSSGAGDPTASARGAIEPVLDDALAALGGRDREAVLLRFFHGRSVREVAGEMGVSEAAAKQRLSRAVARLRDYFARRGVTLADATAAGPLLAMAVRPAPAHVTAASIAAPKLAALATVRTGVPWHHGGHLSTRVAAALLLAAAGAGVVAAGVAALGPRSASGGQAVATPTTPAAATPANAPPPATVPATAPAVTADLSAPGKTLATLAAALEADDQATVEQCLAPAPDGDADARLQRLLIRGNGAVCHLRRAWAARFGGPLEAGGLHLDEFPTLGGGFEAYLRTALAEHNADDVETDGDTASVHLRVDPALLGDVSQPDGRWAHANLTFRRDDQGRWQLQRYARVNVDFVPADAPAAGESTAERTNKAGAFVSGFSQAIERTAAAIEAGTLTSADAASTSIQDGYRKAKAGAKINADGITFQVTPD